MPGSDELNAFVKDALTRGVPRTDIGEVLTRAGWTVEQVKGALAAYADVPFPVPVPRPRPYLSAREAFMYLVLFSTLYLTAYHLGALLFVMINSAFPDPAEIGPGLSAGGGYPRQAIRWSVASLMVAFPVFLYVSWLLGAAVRDDPNKRNSKVRRWLTYMTLFGASCVLIGDVTAVLYHFLGGEIGARFVLKALAVGSIAGLVFWYYLSDLRREEAELAP